MNDAFSLHVSNELAMKQLNFWEWEVAKIWMLLS
jgi:hypothetical protein